MDWNPQPFACAHSARKFKQKTRVPSNGSRYRRLGRRMLRNGKLPKFRNKLKKRAESQPSGARFVSRNIRVNSFIPCSPLHVLAQANPGFYSQLLLVIADLCPLAGRSPHANYEHLQKLRQSSPLSNSDDE